MFFGFFTKRSSQHLKRAATMLRDAQLARMEHQAAGEHHMALASMYTERVKRLELELRGAEAVVPEANQTPVTKDSHPAPQSPEPLRTGYEEQSPVVFALQSKERATAGR